MTSSSAPVAGVTQAPPLPDRGDVSLFFDFDGTLVELAPTPDAVVVAASLTRALEQLAERMPGRIAIVSGRSLEQIDGLLGTLAGTLALSGSHGAEHRLPGIAAAPPAPPATLAAATEELARVAERHGLLLERKTLGAALHYRQRPEAEAEAVEIAAALAQRHGLVLQRGKMMVEVRGDGDKGRALTALLETPAMADTLPLFFGDDVTDEAGFAAARAAGGAGVLVGEARLTAATYRLEGVGALHTWIDALLGDAA